MKHIIKGGLIGFLVGLGLSFLTAVGYTLYFMINPAMGVLVGAGFERFMFITATNLVLYGPLGALVGALIAHSKNKHRVRIEKLLDNAIKQKKKK